MSKRPTLTEIVRDAALDNDCGVDRALVLVKRLNAVYGKDDATKKVLTELVDILVRVRASSRLIHQTAEGQYQADRDDEAIMAQFL